MLQRTACQYGKMFSVVEAVAKYFPVQSDYKLCRDLSMNVFQFIKDMIDRQIESYDAKHERNFIDMYMNKMRAEQKEIADSQRTETTYSCEY